jgi:hypothetical protein
MALGQKVTIWMQLPVDALLVDISQPGKIPEVDPGVARLSRIQEHRDTLWIGLRHAVIYAFWGAFETFFFPSNTTSPASQHVCKFANAEMARRGG